MADSLEQLLQPDERILCHAKKSWLCFGTEAYIAANLFSVAVLSSFGLVTFDQAGLVALASVIASSLGFSLWDYPPNAPSEAMVTDRRMIQQCGLFRPRLVEVKVSTVKQVVAYDDGFRVSNWQGDVVEIRHPNTAMEVGTALAHAADVPPPRPIPRLESSLDVFWLACVVFAAISIGALVLKWLFLSYGAAIFSFSLVLGVGAFIFGGLLANIAGIFFGGLLCLALSRPFLSYQKLECWIENSPIFWPSLDSKEDVDELQSLHLWLAGWLYLRPSSDAERQG